MHHFSVFFAIVPSPNLQRMARRIAKETLIVRYVDQWHDELEISHVHRDGSCQRPIPQRPHAGAWYSARPSPVLEGAPFSIQEA